MTQIALLRGINVGGNKKLTMADLRQLLTELGFAEPRSLLNSGNLLFRSRGQSQLELEQLLQLETEKRLGVRSEFFVRDQEELDAVIASNPFPEAALDDPSHLVVLFLKAEPRDEDVNALQAAIKGREVVRAIGEHLYAVYPDNIGESKLTVPVIEKALRQHCTGRNWNTLLKLQNMAKV